MLAVAAYSGVGSALIGRELKGMQFVAVVFLLGAILFLNHRFNGIASRPSQLAREESPEDRRFFLWFRTICVGVFVLVCVVGVTLHEFGF